jgi:hypothetical protein
MVRSRSGCPLQRYIAAVSRRVGLLRLMVRMWGRINKRNVRNQARKGVVGGLWGLLGPRCLSTGSNQLAIKGNQ